VYLSEDTKENVFKKKLFCEIVLWIGNPNFIPN
jgi:hypothetical protein